MLYTGLRKDCNHLNVTVATIVTNVYELQKMRFITKRLRFDI